MYYHLSLKKIVQVLESLNLAVDVRNNEVNYHQKHLAENIINSITFKFLTNNYVCVHKNSKYK